MLDLPSQLRGIALSLAKRMREILFGVPALLYWQSSSAFFKGTGHVRSSN